MTGMVPWKYQGYEISVVNSGGYWFASVFDGAKRIFRTKGLEREATASREAMAWVAELNEKAAEKAAKERAEKRRLGMIKTAAIEHTVQVELEWSEKSQQWFVTGIENPPYDVGEFIPKDEGAVLDFVWTDEEDD